MSGNTTDKFNYKLLFIISGVILFIYFAFINDNGFLNSSGSRNDKERQLEKSPSLQLATLNNETDSPDEITVALFANLLTSLNNKYPTKSKQDIADGIVSVHNLLLKYGKEVSILELTTEFEAYSAKLAPEININFEQSLALFTKITYKP